MLFPNVAESEVQEREVPPEFISLTRDTKAVPGEPVTFDCQITGTPPPQVYWTKVTCFLSHSDHHDLEMSVIKVSLRETLFTDISIFKCQNSQTQSFS